MNCFRPCGKSYVPRNFFGSACERHLRACSCHRCVRFTRRFCETTRPRCPNRRILRSRVLATKRKSAGAMDELLMKEGIVRGAPVGLGRPLPAGKMQRTPSGNSRTMRPESFVGFIGHRHRAKLASLGALQLHRRELLVSHRTILARRNLFYFLVPRSNRLRFRKRDCSDSTP